MKKRVFDLTREDILTASRQDILAAIQLAEGRTIMAECVTTMQPAIDLVSNPEIAAAFGADMITLNCLDVFDAKVEVLGGEAHGTATSLDINTVKAFTGRLVGCNLEPVPADVTHIPLGRAVSEASVTQAIELGMDYIMLTGNPGMKVSQETILDAIALVRRLSEDIIIIAGKMHGGGVGNDYSLSFVQQFAEAGADIMMFPAPYTTPGITTNMACEIMSEVHKQNMLGLLAIGTSQEGGTESYIEQVAMEAKAAGADIIHIGDGGYSGLAVPENILRLGLTVRGRRHQFKRMANRR